MSIWERILDRIIPNRTENPQTQQQVNIDFGDSLKLITENNEQEPTVSSSPGKTDISNIRGAIEAHRIALSIFILVQFGESTAKEFGELYGNIADNLEKEKNPTDYLLGFIKEMEKLNKYPLNK